MPKKQATPRPSHVPKPASTGSTVRDLIYPNRIPDIIRTLWIEHGPAEKGPPDPSVILAVTEALYYASLSVEEQRPVRARIILASPDELTTRSGPLESVSFSDPPLFSVPELVKLAPAVDPEMTLIAVTPRDRGRAGSRLVMWGLVPIGSQWSKAVHGGGYVMPDFPDALVVSATEPASLMFSRHEHLLAAVRRGRMVTPTVSSLHEGPLSDFFAAATAELRIVVDAMIKEENPNQRRSDHGEPARYNSVLERILSQIRTLGHGGAILVVPNEIAPDDARLGNLVTLKYRADRQDLWTTLVHSVAHHAISHDLDRRAKRSRKGVSSAEYKRATFSDGYWLHMEDRLSDEIAFAARLSGVDGAIVMTDRLKVLGFGAEIIAKIDVPDVHIPGAGKSGGTVRRSVERYGTRHRSAFRFCASTPFQSAAFIVSQDGGIRAVRQVGPRLTMWEEIATGEFAL